MWWQWQVLVILTGLGSCQSHLLTGGLAAVEEMLAVTHTDHQHHHHDVVCIVDTKTGYNGWSALYRNQIAVVVTSSLPGDAENVLDRKPANESAALVVFVFSNNTTFLRESKVNVNSEFRC